jgi:hypothetical protein
MKDRQTQKELETARREAIGHPDYQKYSGWIPDHLRNPVTAPTARRGPGRSKRTPEIETAAPEVTPEVTPIVPETD